MTSFQHMQSVTFRLNFGSVRFGKSVNRLTDRLPNRPVFGKNILFRLPNQILSVKSVGGQFRFGRGLVGDNRLICTPLDGGE
jgi:hypothetical protein